MKLNHLSRADLVRRYLASRSLLPESIELLWRCRTLAHERLTLADTFRGRPDPHEHQPDTQHRIRSVRGSTGELQSARASHLSDLRAARSFAAGPLLPASIGRERGRRLCTGHLRHHWRAGGSIQRTIRDTP